MEDIHSSIYLLDIDVLILLIIGKALFSVSDRSSIESISQRYIHHFEYRRRHVGVVVELIRLQPLWYIGPAQK